MVDLAECIARLQKTSFLIPKTTVAVLLEEAAREPRRADERPTPGD